MKFRKTHYVNQTPLYEENFARMLRLAPGLANDIGFDQVSVCHSNGTHLDFTIQERHRFTAVVRVDLHLDDNNAYLPNPLFLVRVYFDARVAEVISYQTHSRFEADYPYPNESMLQPDEKRQVNHFLGEILNNFLCRNASFDSLLNKIL